jgi:NAD(P)-dependent dehydrogenase (short-subunit alcohol dehydrogenase family)
VSASQDTEKVAVVTGAAQGIGRATADRLASDGYRIAVVDFRAEPAEKVASEIRESGVDAAAFNADVGDSEAVGNATREILERFGRLDVLVNNAGTHVPGDVVDISDEDFDRVVGTILKGTFYFSRAVLPTMIEQESGSIVNVSSVWAWACAPGAAPYCLAKAGVVALTKSLAAEVAKYGIRVNAVAPYLVNTELHRASHSDEARREMAAASPMGRECEPEEIAAGISFLVSGDASWVAGETLTLSGASLLR